jgi:hypothetical protein
MGQLERTAEVTKGLVVARGSLGLAERSVRARGQSGRLERLAPRIYRIPGSVPGWHQQLLAAVLAAGPGACASHASAAQLWGLPGFTHQVIEVSRPRQRHHEGLLGTVHESRRLPESHRRVVDGIPATSPARTLFDLCGSRSVHPAKAERAIANALSHQLVRFGQLEVVLAEMGRRGRRGSALFRKVVDDLGGAGYAPTESDLEDLTLAVLRAAGLPDPECQVEVGDAEGPVRRVDFLYSQARLIIEGDGRVGHSSWLDMEADRRRDARLLGAGYRVLRVTWRTLREEPSVLTDAVRAILTSG